MIFGESLIADRNALDGIELDCLTDKFHEIKVSVFCQSLGHQRADS
jgi:hypothetical protein